MFTVIANTFVSELRQRQSVRVIVSDSSDEDLGVESHSKRRRGRPKKKAEKEETIMEILSLSTKLRPVQEVTILGNVYNKCIYTSELYDKSGIFVGMYDAGRIIERD